MTGYTKNMLAASIINIAIFSFCTLFMLTTNWSQFSLFFFTMSVLLWATSACLSIFTIWELEESIKTK